MNYITAENLSKSYGVRLLFENVNLYVNEGDKIALVAKNGSGKSTLLKILTGKEIPDSGEVIVHKDIRSVLFDQEIDFNHSQSVEDYMMQLDIAPIRALKNYHKALRNTATPEEMEAALADMEQHKAWDIENEIKQFLSQLKIENTDAKMGSLSGGEVKRVALAKLLTETRATHIHTLLIMDEPTNHLDVEMVEWLENYLNKEKITLLLVTHDRYFLDSVCDTIWELEDHTLYTHRGGYASYLENKALREENKQSTIDKANNLYRKELEWMRRQPKARTTKSKSRIDAFYETEKTAKTRLDDAALSLDFEMKRLGKKILELHSVSKSFGDKLLFKDFSYQFQRGEKVGIVGKNGAGKSTLLNIIQGLEKPDTGEVETGETLHFGYFSQKGIQFREEERVIDHIKEVSEHFPLAGGRLISASQFLRMFLFDDQAQYAPVSKLSGGEKRRLHLMTVLYRNPNFLIFDEPTNDLDLPTLTVLEQFLQQFQGCVLIVSHDRYFMDRITDHILAFEGEGKIRDFTGTFTEYRAYRQKLLADTEPAPATKSPEISPKKNQPARRKLSFKEKTELSSLEDELPELESRRDALADALNNETDYEKITGISEELQKITDRLSYCEMRWLELQEVENG